MTDSKGDTKASLMYPVLRVHAPSAPTPPETPRVEMSEVKLAVAPETKQEVVPTVPPPPPPRELVMHLQIPNQPFEIVVKAVNGPDGMPIAWVHRKPIARRPSRCKCCSDPECRKGIIDMLLKFAFWAVLLVVFGAIGYGAYVGTFQPGIDLRDISNRVQPANCTVNELKFVYQESSGCHWYDMFVDVTYYQVNGFIHTPDAPVDSNPPVIVVHAEADDGAVLPRDDPDDRACDGKTDAQPLCAIGPFVQRQYALTEPRSAAVWRYPYALGSCDGLHGYTSFSTMAEIIANAKVAFPIGSTLKCLVDPLHPQDVYLTHPTRGRGYTAAFVPIVIALVLFCCAVCVRVTNELEEWVDRRISAPKKPQASSRAT